MNKIWCVNHSRVYLYFYQTFVSPWQSIYWFSLPDVIWVSLTDSGALGWGILEDIWDFMLLRVNFCSWVIPSRIIATNPRRGASPFQVSTFPTNLDVAFSVNPSSSVNPSFYDFWSGSLQFLILVDCSIVLVIIPIRSQEEVNIVSTYSPDILAPAWVFSVILSSNWWIDLLFYLTCFWFLLVFI